MKKRRSSYPTPPNKCSSVKLKIKNFLKDSYDRFLIYRRRKSEIKKFEDARRKNIYEKVILSKEQKSAIDRLYLENYGEKIPYTWHRHFTAFTGNFTEKYFPELLFIPEFEHFMNLFPAYTKTMSDKNLLFLIAQSGNVEMPKSFVNSAAGILRDNNYTQITLERAVEILSNIGAAFIKPTVDSGSGQGCMCANFENGIDTVSGKEIAELIKNLGNDWVIQENIKCSNDIRRIYSCCVNTFRIITYRWKEKIYHMPIIMRIGQGNNFLDNAHAGGMFIAVDDDGTLHKTAYTEFKNEFNKHPDTGVVFNGYKIKNVDKCIAAAEHMCTLVPQLGCVNWDFTINENEEPILIEANTECGSVWLIEMAHGVGPFGENTEEILKWMRNMKNTPVSMRDAIMFGKRTK